MSDSNPTANNIVIHSGFLNKQGGNVHNWKIRWFILKHGSLSYYSTNINWETSRPRGIILLHKNTEVNDTLYKNRKNCFTISCNDSNNNSNNTSQSPDTKVKSASRVFLISAQTVFDQKKWIEMIRLACKPQPLSLPISINNNHNNHSNNISIRTSNESDDNGLSQSQPTSLIGNRKFSEQLSSSLKDIAVSWKRKESFNQAPTLLNHKHSLESINNAIRVTLSKRKLIFTQDNLSIPSLPYGGDESLITKKPTPTSPFKKGILFQQSSPITVIGNNHNNIHKGSGGSSGSSGGMGSSNSSSNSSGNESYPNSNNNNNNNSSNNNSPIFSISSSSNSSNSKESNGGMSPSSPGSPRSGINDTNNSNNNNTPISTSSSSSPFYSPFTPLSSPKVNHNDLITNDHQSNPTVKKIDTPTIVVFHLAKDTFQISNIGLVPISFEILSPFDLNYTLNYYPQSGSIAPSTSITIQVEIIVYANIEVDVYSTVHIRGGMDFTLYARVKTDHILPLFLRACGGSVLDDSELEIMYTFMKARPMLVKPIQELAHTMIHCGRHVNPKTLSPTPSLKQQQAINSLNLGAGDDVLIDNSKADGTIDKMETYRGGVRLTKHILYFQRKQEIQTVPIYQLVTDKFLLSNSSQKDFSFQFHIPGYNNNRFKLSLVPMNGVLAKGEWFTIKCSLTSFVETELTELVQLTIDSKEVHYILVRCISENIHAGNKEIDIKSELVIQQRLGAGAAGDVYQALISSNNLKEHISRQSFEQGKWLRRNPSDLSIMVAVKFIHQHADPTQETIHDFFSEIRTLSMLSHPNIVKYIGGCTSIGNWAIVMEYIPGGNLLEVLQDRMIELPYKLVLKMALDIAQGMHYLHSIGILHLDLKSPNLLVSSLSLTAKVNLKVTDFNTSVNRTRITNKGKKGYKNNGKNNNNSDSNDSTPTPLKGTTAWQAPEVIRGAIYSEKCDVYSFAIIAWEMIARQLPYSHVSFNNQIEELVLRGERPAIPDICPLEYKNLLENCWHQDPIQRPSFDQIIHTLTLMIQEYEVQEQKVKASFRGLRRVHSGSSLIVSPAITRALGNTPVLTDSSNGLDGTPPIHYVEDILQGKNKSRVFGVNHSKLLIGDNDKINLVEGNLGVANNNTKDTSRTKSKIISKLFTRVQRPKSQDLDSLVKQLQQPHQPETDIQQDSAPSAIENSNNTNYNSTINHPSNISLVSNQSNQFKFSPPTTPSSSFKKSKIDEDLYNQNQKEKSFLNFAPSFTRALPTTSPTYRSYFTNKP